MKRHLIYTIINLFFVFNQVWAQDPQALIETPIPSNTCSNLSVQFNGYGTASSVGTSFSFDGVTLPTGWTSSAYTVGQPCNASTGDTPDNTNYFWASDVAGERYVKTNNLDVSLGGSVSFLLRFGNDDPDPGCEQADSGEGVYLQYTNDNGGTWTNIDYYDPGSYYSWTAIDIEVPESAQTASTSFRWVQTTSSGVGFDNWGLENVQVTILEEVVIDTYLWNFGDGTTATTKNATHTYASSGTYNVSFKITGTGFPDDEVNSTYIVLPNQTPSFNSIANIVIPMNGSGNVTLNGIDDGDDCIIQNISASVSSSNTTLLSNLGLSYTSPNSSGTLSIIPVNNEVGNSTVTVLIDDNGTYTGGASLKKTSQKAFNVYVNDIPTNPGAFTFPSGDKLFIDDSYDIAWGISSDQTASVTYDLEYMLDGGSWTSIVSNTNSVLYANWDGHKNVSYIGRTIQFRVRSYDGDYYSANYTSSSIYDIEAKVVPSLITTAITTFGTTSATMGGNITDNGEASVTERGVVYSVTSINSNPEIGGTGVAKNTNGTGVGIFSESILGLPTGTTYSVQAYAINSVGTSYGGVESFTTLVPTIAFNATSSNASEAINSADLQVDLSAVSSFDVLVDYTVSGTAIGSGTDFTLANGTLLIPAGDLTNNITISGIVNDLLYERNETVIVTLSSASNASLGTNTVHTYSIDNDDDAPKVSLSLSSSEIGEGDGSVKLIATLSEISDVETQIFLKESTGTATFNFINPELGDYTANNDRIFIAPGKLSNFLEVSIIQDNLVEKNETIIADIRACDDGIVDGDQQQIATIIDDDVAGFTISETDGGTTVFESGLGDSFTVVLDAQPITDVVLNILSGDTDEATVGQVSITFTNSDWNVPQTIDLNGVDDVIDDGDQNTTITLSIDATGSNDGFDLVSNKTLTVITEDDDESPVVTANQSYAVNENSTIGTSVGTVLATDADSGTTFSNWMITGGNTDAIFAIDSGTGEITLVDNTNLDFESTTGYILSISVSDGTNTSAVEDVVITIMDVNEAPNTIQLSNLTIAENLTVGSEIGILTASDEDANQNFIFTMAENENFEIVGDKLITKLSLNFEAQNSYSVEITVADQGDLSYLKNFTIQITDENDSPTAIHLSNASIAENTAIGTEVGILTSTDEDASQTFTYAITDNDNFELIGDQLVSKAVFNFAIENNYSIEITVSDQGGLSFTKSFTIQIQNRNEAPTAIQLSKLTIAENLAIGAEVGILTATDPDINQIFTYKLAENSYFDIDGDKIVSKASFNAEDHISYSIKVTVTDQGGLSFDERFTINIEDVNEVPEFLSEPILEARVGEEYTYTIKYQDVDGDKCNLSALEMPSWLSLVDYANGTGTLSGIPTESDVFNVSLELSDGPLSASQEFEIKVAITTGIEAVFTAAKVSIYPNPTADELHIDLSDFANREFSISLCDMTGSQVFKEQCKTIGGEAKIHKSIQQLQSGLYLLVIESEGLRKAFKIVKQ